MQITNIIESFSTSVSCCGEKSLTFGHPRIYLEIDRAKGEIICPYCATKFKYINV